MSTLPLPVLLRLLDPAPSASLIDAVAALTYRHVRLAIVRLDVPRFSSHASLYFPEPSLPFTRLYEPKNRCATMAPANRTALVIEVPCGADDVWWTLDDEGFVESLKPHLDRALGDRMAPRLSMHSLRLPHAYPVLEVGHRTVLEKLFAYLEGFENLTLSGRAGTFRYLHTHDLFAEAEAWAKANQIKRRTAQVC